jgi:hypothetical protein
VFCYPVACEALPEGRFQGVIAYILFALTGFVFGWAIPSKAAYVVPILIPIIIAIPTAVKQGVDGKFVVSFIVAIVVTVIGIVVGRMVAHSTESGHAEPADDDKAAAAS